MYDGCAVLVKQRFLIEFTIFMVEEGGFTSSFFFMAFTLVSTVAVFKRPGPFAPAKCNYNENLACGCTVCRAGLKPMQLHWAPRLWGPAPWCLGRLFIFARCTLRLKIQKKRHINSIVNKERSLQN